MQNFVSFFEILREQDAVRAPKFANSKFIIPMSDQHAKEQILGCYIVFKR
jgi:hypothetical protein